MFFKKKPAEFIALRDQFIKCAVIAPDRQTITVEGYKAEWDKKMGSGWIIHTPPLETLQDGRLVLPGPRLINEAGCWFKRSAIRTMAAEAACDKLYGRTVRPEFMYG